MKLFSCYPDIAVQQTVSHRTDRRISYRGISYCRNIHQTSSSEVSHFLTIKISWQCVYRIQQDIRIDFLLTDIVKCNLTFCNSVFCGKLGYYNIIFVCPPIINFRVIIGIDIDISYVIFAKIQLLWLVVNHYHRIIDINRNISFI